MARNFDDLFEALPDAEIFLPGYVGYEDRIKRWSASCNKRAAVIVCPRNAFEVSTALRYATTHQIFPLAVRGGGHSTSGDSSSDGGMAIDLRQINSTTVDPKKRTITFGGGCKWQDVNDALWDHGLATVSGTVGDTGVGGLILCGGYGYLTGRCGLALDCLISCELVLANGDIVKASKDDNPDLFWALRGAGPNFGIVTHFTSQAFLQEESWAGFLGFTPECLAAVVEFGNHFIQMDDGNGVMAVVFHNGSQEEGRKRFKPLLDLELLGDTTSMLSYPDLNMMFNKYPRGADDRHRFGGANFTFPLNKEAAQKIGNQFWETTNAPENEDLRSSTIGFEFFPTNKIREIPLADTAFANRGQFASICISMNWTEASMDNRACELSTEFSQLCADSVGWKGNKYHEGATTYANYFSSVTKAEKIYGQNTVRLRRLKNKYDPQQVFQKVQDLSPKQ
ncbi:hypothetical protein N7452_007538 [Penicillium brevicompactum]|uniref:FAD-binding PCMH-type domain-containing protein n=1 Tax=Penicillium brevicompactum TaxID=5074 RepID=A0A9W9QFE1_PENBR|nr:hypothetical protein N7452_007538 [Penicillium brevicompactum]